MGFQQLRWNGGARCRVWRTLTAVLCMAACFAMPSGAQNANQPERRMPPDLKERAGQAAPRPTGAVAPPGVVRRTATPAQSPPAAAAPEPKTAAPPSGAGAVAPGPGMTDTSEGIFLDYQDQDLAEVVKSLGAYTGKNFEIDPTLTTQKVTVISHSPIPPELAYEALSAIVASKKAHLVESVEGNLVQVLPVAQGQEKADLSTDPEAMPDESDRFATHIIGVTYADATELAGLLPSLGSENARVDAYGVTNTLILTDTATGVRNMLTFLREVDVAGFEETIEIFFLRYARAEVVSTQVLDVLTGEAGGGGPQQPGQAVRQAVRPVRAQIPGRKEQTIVGRQAQALRIVPDERLNSLIVVAAESLMDQVADLIDKLDRPTPTDANNMHVYNLLNADAETLGEALSNFVGNVTPQQGGGGGQGGQGGGGGASPEVQPFQKEVHITTYDKNNSLLIMASGEDYKLLEAVIKRLDVPQRQVHVEAMIIKVTINDQFELSVEAAGLTANDAFTLNNVANIANVLTGSALDTAGPGLTVGILDGTTRIPVSNEAGEVTLQTVPNVPILLNALEFLTALDVLSQPSLTTVDNEEANIVIGQEVPFVTGSSRALAQTATNASVYNTVQREDIGIKMDVTPQISEGDYVYLDLNVTVSALASAQQSVGDPNLLGPTLDKTEITDKVVIRDGATGIMGGLISEAATRTKRQTPWLGDIPLLGWLFRRKTDLRRKENLIVLVTPHILKDSTDVARLTTYKADEAEQANADVIFERGFLRKVEKKNYLHNRFRPGQERLEDFQLKNTEFQRGDIKR